jgi:hypothetical protein
MAASLRQHRNQFEMDWRMWDGNLRALAIGAVTIGIALMVGFGFIEATLRAFR